MGSLDVAAWMLIGASDDGSESVAHPEHLVGPGFRACRQRQAVIIAAPF